MSATGRQIHDALTEVGFFVLTGHGVPSDLIAHTFAEAKRLHDLPMDTKLSLRLNAHNNGYMARGRYAVWTSDVNKNATPDLNAAFFIKRRRAGENPVRRVGPGGGGQAHQSDEWVSLDRVRGAVVVDEQLALAYLRPPS